MGKRGIGVDVGGTEVKFGLFSGEGELLRRWKIPTDRTDNCANVIRGIAESIRREMAADGLSLTDLAGIGMAVPGPVQPDGFVEVCVNLHWKKRYPARELSGLLDGVRVEIGNDANAAALGEAWKGGGAGVQDAVLFTLGTGVGGGVILGGKILNGHHGIGGEVGHMHVRDGETEVCNCGGRGCLEQVASATGIVREAKRAMENSSAPTRMREFGEKITAKDVCDLGRAGDPMADAVMETVARYLGIAISHVCVTVDPEVFIIGGGVSRAGSYLIDKIQKYFRQYTTISQNHADVVLATLGNDAGIYGAVRMVLADGKE